MDKAPDFDLLPDDTTDLTNTCPIIIKSGKFKDIVYRYGKISFKELDDGSLNVSMEVEMIKAPEILISKIQSLPRLLVIFLQQLLNNKLQHKKKILKPMFMKILWTIPE